MSLFLFSPGAFSSDLALCPLTQNNKSWGLFSFCQAISQPWRVWEEEAISMLIGAFLLVSIPPSLRPMLFPQHCVFLALTFLYLLSHSPNTQSHCCCLATLPFTSQPLFTSALLPPSLSLFLSGLMNGVAGLWAAHPRRGVASHRWLSHIRAGLGAFLCCPCSLRLRVASQIQSQIHQNLAWKSGRQPSPEVTLGTINATAAVTWQRAHLSHRSHRFVCIFICRLGSVQRSVLKKSKTNTQVTQQSCCSFLANTSSLLRRKAASASACIIAQKLAKSWSDLAKSPFPFRSETAPVSTWLNMCNSYLSLRGSLSSRLNNLPELSAIPSCALCTLDPVLSRLLKAQLETGQHAIFPAICSAADRPSVRGMAVGKRLSHREQNESLPPCILIPYT